MTFYTKKLIHAAVIVLAGIVLCSFPVFAIDFEIDFTADYDSLTISLTGITWVTYHGSYTVTVSSTSGYEGEYTGTFDAAPFDNAVDTSYVCIWNETLSGLVTITGTYELSTERSFDPHFNYPIFSGDIGPLYLNSEGELSAPVITTVSLPDATEDDGYSATIEITDSDDGDSHFFVLLSGPEWLTIDPDTGVLSGTPENEDVGEGDSLSVRVNDSYGLTDEASYAITVLNVNDNPEILTASLPGAQVNQAYSAAIAVIDLDSGDTHSFQLLTHPGWLSIDGTGHLSGTPGINDRGTGIPVIVRVTDSGTPALSDTLFTTISVTLGFNMPPDITTAGLPDATENIFYSVTINVSDPNVTDTHTFQLLSGPDWMSLNTTSGVLSGTPDNFDVGSNISVTIQVADNGGLTDKATYSINVLNVNNPPVILTTTLPNAEVNSNYNAVIVVTDPDAGESFTYSFISHPAWLSINSLGVLSGTPGSGDAGVNIPVSIVVTDSGTPALRDTLTTMITVKSVSVFAPEITTTTLPDATQDVVYNATISVTDPDIGDFHTFKLLTKPDWLSIGKNTGILTGTPHNNNVGENIEISVQVTDSGGLTDTASYMIDVIDVNDAPVILTTALPDADVDQSYSSAITISDPDAGDTHSYALIIKPGWLSVDSSGNLSGTPVSGDESEDVQISVSVTDNGTPALSDTFTTSITVCAIPVSPPEITTETLPNAAKNTAYTAMIEVSDTDIGDKHTFVLLEGPAWLSINLNSGIFSGTPGYDDIGENIQLSVLVTDRGGFTDEATFMINVLNVNTAPQLITESLPDGEVNKSYSAVIDAVDPDIGDSLSFEIENGPSWLSIAPETGILSGTPGNSDSGSAIPVTISVTDNGDLSDETTYYLNVIDVNDAPIIVTHSLPNAMVNNEYSARIMVFDPDMGDTHLYQLLDAPGWLSIIGNGNLTGTPDSTAIGEEIPVTVQVTDSGNPPLSALFSTTISVLPETHYEPEITTLSLPDAYVDSVYSAVIEAIDADEGDSLYYELVECPGCFSIDPLEGAISGIPEIDHVGQAQRITVRVTDCYGLFTEVTYTITIHSANIAPMILTETLPDGEACEAYSAIIEISDPDSADTHIFELLTAPEWLQIDEEGTLSGEPVSQDAGTDILISVRVSDSGNPPLSDTLSTSISVIIPEIVSIIILPDSVSVTEGNVVQYTAVACDAEGDTIDVALTWTVSGEDIGSIDETGLFTASDAGEGEICASYRSNMSSVPVMVDYIREYSFDLKDDSKVTFSGLKFPLDYMNGMQMIIPKGALAESISISMKFPTFGHINKTQHEISFDNTFIKGMTFKVKVNGSVVDPYVFDSPIELIIPYDSSLLAERGISPNDLGVFYLNALNELTSDGIIDIAVFKAQSFIIAHVSHLSDIIIAPKEITTVTENNSPTEFSLAQNYPNPFNPETTISFGIPENTHVEITIYSILGQRIKILVSETKSPGNYAFVWDATDDNGNRVTSGTYIYRISAGSYTTTKKMILLK